MSVEFPDMQAWDGGRLAVSFPAIVDGKQVVCRVSMEALQDAYDPHGDAEEIFIGHRGDVELVAEGLITSGRFESDGSILIQSFDLA